MPILPSKEIPLLNRSNLYRCLKRHGLQKLSKQVSQHNNKTPSKKKFKQYPIGYFHIDITELKTKQVRLNLFVAIDRTSKTAYAKLYDRKTAQIACQFLQELIRIIPYKIHTILTDNGRQFTHLKPSGSCSLGLFDRLCQKEGIKHRLTKPYHPWTNGQVERMNRCIKEATVYRYYYISHRELREHLNRFLNAYNFAKRLKVLKGLTPYEFIKQCWTKEPERFKIKPSHYNLKPYI